MEKILYSIENNQGVTMCVLTAIYVIVTVAIYICNLRSINEMKKSREQESRPYVIASFHKEAREIYFYLRIKNYGKSGAKINNIEITPSLKFMYGKDAQEFLKGAILGPNQMIQFIIFDEKEVLCKNSYNIKLDYCCIDNNKKVYSDKYSAVIQYAQQMGYSDHATTNLTIEQNALENIANHLDTLIHKI